MEKNEIKKLRVESIMETDRDTYMRCGEAVVRLMDGFDIPIEFQLNLIKDLHESLLEALKERHSEDSEQYLSLDEIENVTKEKLSQWRQDDEGREQMLGMIDSLFGETHDDCDCDSCN